MENTPTALITGDIDQGARCFSTVTTAMMTSLPSSVIAPSTSRYADVGGVTDTAQRRYVFSAASSKRSSGSTVKGSDQLSGSSETPTPRVILNNKPVASLCCKSCFQKDIETDSVPDETQTVKEASSSMLAALSEQCIKKLCIKSEIAQLHVHADLKGSIWDISTWKKHPICSHMDSKLQDVQEKELAEPVPSYTKDDLGRSRDSGKTPSVQRLESLRIEGGGPATTDRKIIEPTNLQKHLCESTDNQNHHKESATASGQPCHPNATLSSSAAAKAETFVSSAPSPVLHQEKAKELKKEGENSTMKQCLDESRPLEKTSTEAKQAELTRYKLLLAENRRLKRRQHCLMCQQNEANMTLLPCGHLAYCRDCASKLSHCGICRREILADVVTFLC